MKSIQEMLDRGFGMVPINELQSINYHDNTMFLVFAPATGFTDQSIYYEIEGRTNAEILQEIYDYTTQYMTTYLAVLLHSITKM